MIIVNPTSGRQSIFMDFTLALAGEVYPFIENGTIHASVDLLHASIDLQNSAFPPEWKDFVGDLIEGNLYIGKT